MIVVSRARATPSAVPNAKLTASCIDITSMGWATPLDWRVLASTVRPMIESDLTTVLDTVTVAEPEFNVVRPAHALAPPVGVQQFSVGGVQLGRQMHQALGDHQVDQIAHQMVDIRQNCRDGADFLLQWYFGVLQEGAKLGVLEDLAGQAKVVRPLVYLAVLDGQLENRLGVSFAGDATRHRLLMPSPVRRPLPTPGQ